MGGLGVIVHKILPQARILPDLDAGWTERPLSAASWPEWSADGRGGRFRTWRAAWGIQSDSAAGVLDGQWAGDQSPSGSVVCPTSIR
jgi:hypothetical protein